MSINTLLMTLMLFVHCTRAVPVLRKPKGHSAIKVEDDAYSGDFSVQPHGNVTHLPHLGVILSQQLEYELRVTARQPTDPQVVNKVLISVVSLVFSCGFCGVDRCLMGQPLLGALKGFTCGGCFVWYIIDWVIIAYNCFISAPDIDMLGFVATWVPATVGTAFYIAIFATCCHCFCLCLPKDKAKFKTQAAMRQWHSRNLGMRMCFGDQLPFIGQPNAMELMFFFQKIDKDGSGKISREELNSMFIEMGCDPLTEDEWAKALANADKNNDGELDFNEFVAWYTS